MINRFPNIFAIGILLAGSASAWAIGGIDSPPAPGTSHSVSFVEPKDIKLDNGLRVVVAERPALPLLAAYLLIRHGAEVDPDNLAGTASLTGSLLTKGTEKMSAPEIANAIESLGGAISSGAGWDSSSATVSAMSDKAEPMLAILADVVLHPAFKQEEIDRLKHQKLDGIRVALQQPGSLAAYVTTRVVFGSGEYGHAAGGTMETVGAISRDDIVKLYRTYYTPTNATLIFTGKITLEEGRAFAQRYFGEWKGEAADKAASVRPPSEWKPSNVVIDMPQAGQASVTVAKPAIRRDSPDYYAGLVANAALGNGFVSRLNREIRIRRGLSYGARSSLDTRREPGPFAASAQTKNESAAEVAGLLQNELKRLATDPVQGEELKSRQAVLTGGYARNMETNSGFAGQIAALTTYNLPLKTINEFIPAINAITSTDVTGFAKAHFTEPASLIIVGRAPAFLEPLKKALPDVRVIAQGELELNRAELVRSK